MAPIELLRPEWGMAVVISPPVICSDCSSSTLSGRSLLPRHPTVGEWKLSPSKGLCSTPTRSRHHGQFLVTRSLANRHSTTAKSCERTTRIGPLQPRWKSCLGANLDQLITTDIGKVTSRPPSPGAAKAGGRPDEFPISV
jgi:hypothetical protein